MRALAISAVNAVMLVQRWVTPGAVGLVSRELPRTARRQRLRSRVRFRPVPSSGPSCRAADAQSYGERQYGPRPILGAPNPDGRARYGRAERTRRARIRV